MTLILYYGRETGFEEKDALLEYLPTIDSSKYTVVEMPFVNRSNCPPIPILISTWWNILKKIVSRIIVTSLFVLQVIKMTTMS